MHLKMQKNCSGKPSVVSAPLCVERVGAKETSLVPGKMLAGCWWRGALEQSCRLPIASLISRYLTSNNQGLWAGCDGWWVGLKRWMRFTAAFLSIVLTFILLTGLLSHLQKGSKAQPSGRGIWMSSGWFGSERSWKYLCVCMHTSTEYPFKPQIS